MVSVSGHWAPLASLPRHRWRQGLLRAKNAGDEPRPVASRYADECLAQPRLCRRVGQERPAFRLRLQTLLPIHAIEETERPITLRRSGMVGQGRADIEGCAAGRRRYWRNDRPFRSSGHDYAAIQPMQSLTWALHLKTRVRISRPPQRETLKNAPKRRRTARKVAWRIRWTRRRRGFRRVPA